MNEKLALMLVAPSILLGVCMVHWLETLVRYVVKRIRRR
jgi:hypothetical protein